MNRRILFIIGSVLVLGVILAAVAVAQDNEKTKVHECTPQMMESNGSDKMTKNCTPEEMDSASCENMRETSMEGCISMMENTKENSHMSDPGHCGDSGMGSMMGANKGPMM